MDKIMKDVFKADQRSEPLNSEDEVDAAAFTAGS